MPMLCGGTGETKPATPEVQKICDEVKLQVEEKAGKTFEVFNAKQYKSQVVAGTNFFIKVHTGGDDFVHVRVHQALPHENQKLTVHSLQSSKTKEDDIVYF
ncbi:cystatin 14a, tandem duplicate 2 [Amia ocellicauda]|uniref:cystatin 14a, tandem duplicate 2 n=1 Tax=Amia ocellicauda TaxID=2972642 RepID=UPI003463A083